MPRLIWSAWPLYGSAPEGGKGLVVYGGDHDELAAVDGRGGGRLVEEQDNGAVAEADGGEEGHRGAIRETCRPLGWRILLARF